MTDIVPDFNVCLKEKGGQQVARRTYDLDKINSFLQEAYSINARIADLTRELRSIRPNYLSTAPAQRRGHYTNGDNHKANHVLTDADRDALDAESKKLLRELNGKITGLKQAEEVRIQTQDSVALSKRARGGLGALGRWAAGGAVTAKSPQEEEDDAARKRVAESRESVIWYLQIKLEEAGRVQSEMMEVRLGREVEKSKSVLYKSRIAGGIPYAQDEDMDSPMSVANMKKNKRRSANYANGTLDSTTDPSSAREELSSEQLQIFAEENADLLKHYEDQLDQVRTAERSILEISELHSTLHANLIQQSEHIDQLVEDSYLTTENLGKGNKELKRASERKSTAQAVFFGTLGFCTFLIAWDAIF